MLRKEEDEQNKEATEKGMRGNPLLPFTLEEEFKVIDVIVRMQDYIAKRFIFVQQNFGDDVFPNYSKLATEKTVCTNTSGKLSYNPVKETQLFNLALKVTQSNINNFFDEMKYLSTNVKMDMLKTSFPATYIIFYAILETNNGKQTSFPGHGQSPNIRLKDMERFTSPWALDYADEVKFESTVRKLGEVLGSDTKLQVLYTMLVMITPQKEQVKKLFLN